MVTLNVVAIINFCKKCQGICPRGKRDFCSKKCQGESEGTWLTAGEDTLKLSLAATTGWRPLPLDPVINVTSSEPILGMGDIHLPLIDEIWAERAIRTARHYGVRKCVINGDLVDANQVSRHLGGEYRRRSELNDDIESTQVFLALLLQEFDEVYYTLGNHSARMIQKFMGEVSWQNLAKMMSANEKFKVTERHFLDVNGAVRFLHPRSYSRVRGKLTADLAQRYQMHLITSHHHHSAQTISADGMWQAVEIGCLAKIDLFGYAQYAMHGMPEMLNGFCIVLPPSENNLILNFNKFSPWKRYGLPSI